MRARTTLARRGRLATRPFSPPFFLSFFSLSSSAMQMRSLKKFFCSDVRHPSSGCQSCVCVPAGWLRRSLLWVVCRRQATGGRSFSSHASRPLAKGPWPSCPASFFPPSFSAPPLPRPLPPLGPSQVSCLSVCLSVRFLPSSLALPCCCPCPSVVKKCSSCEGCYKNQKKKKARLLCCL